MSISLSAVTRRLPLIQGSRDKITDKLGGKSPSIPRGNAVSYPCAIFIADPKLATLVDDLSNLASVSMQARLGGPLGNSLFSKTVAVGDFDNPALTWAEWENNTSQHFTFRLTAEETGQDLAGKDKITVYLAFEAQPLVGDPIFLGSITTEIFEDGIGSSGAAVVGDPSYLTAAQSRAEFGARGITCADFRPDLTGLDGETETDLDSIATAALVAGYLIELEVPNLGIKRFRLRTGAAEQELPGLVLPFDYDETTNPKFWESV